VSLRIRGDGDGILLQFDCLRKTIKGCVAEGRESVIKSQKKPEGEEQKKPRKKVNSRNFSPVTGINFQEATSRKSETY